MELELFNEKTVTLWNRMSGELPAGGLHVELDLYKKLLNFFQVGDYYYFIFNFKTIGFDLISP